MSRPSDDLPPNSNLLQRILARLFQNINKPDPHSRLAQYFALNKAVGQLIAHTNLESALLESLCTLAVQNTSVALAWGLPFRRRRQLKHPGRCGRHGLSGQFCGTANGPTCR